MNTLKFAWSGTARQLRALVERPKDVNTDTEAEAWYREGVKMSTGTNEGDLL